MASDDGTLYVAVVGSRTFDDYARLERVLDALIESCDAPAGTDVRIVSGGARGADLLAAAYAAERSYALAEFKPDWHKGGGAGIARNADIVKYCDRMVAFWDGASPGTRDSIQRARAAGKDVLVVAF